MRIDELIRFIQTYEMSLPNSQKPKESTFKAFKNEGKKTKNPNDLTRMNLLI